MEYRIKFEISGESVFTGKFGTFAETAVICDILNRKKLGKYTPVPMVSVQERYLEVVCSVCGSDEVLCDAYAAWDSNEQTWVLQTTFDKGSYCEVCEGETRLLDVYLTPEEFNYVKTSSTQPVQEDSSS